MDFSVLGDVVNNLVNWILSFGAGWIYLAILFASFVENIFPPFPGDTVTVVGAALAAHEDVSFTLVFVGATVGGMISTMLIYWFGQRHGHNYFMKRDLKYFPREKVIEFERWLAQSGSWLILGHRFIVGFRTVVALAAGVARWPAWRMILFATLSFVLFNAILMTAAYLLADNLSVLVRWIGIYKTYFFIALGIAAFWIVYVKIIKRKSARNV